MGESISAAAAPQEPPRSFVASTGRLQVRLPSFVKVTVVNDGPRPVRVTEVAFYNPLGVPAWVDVVLNPDPDAVPPEPMDGATRSSGCAFAWGVDGRPMRGQHVLLSIPVPAGEIGSACPTPFAVAPGCSVGWCMRLEEADRPALGEGEFCRRVDGGRGFLCGSLRVDASSLTPEQRRELIRRVQDRHRAAGRAEPEPPLTLDGAIDRVQHAAFDTSVMPAVDFVPSQVDEGGLNVNELRSVMGRPPVPAGLPDYLRLPDGPGRPREATTPPRAEEPARRPPQPPEAPGGPSGGRESRAAVALFPSAETVAWITAAEEEGEGYGAD